MPRQDNIKEWDAFISHASEDKDQFVRPLVAALQAEGLRIWYDELTLTVGDSLRRSIDEGLLNSQYSIVILSPSFLKKGWTQHELDGLLARQIGGQKVILPVWHNITRDELMRYSPSLADKLGVSSAQGIPHVVRELLRAMQRIQADDIPLKRKDYEPETILIPAGPFVMGVEATGAWQQHKVILPAYEIGKYPVTNEQYAEFVEQKPEHLAEMRKVWRAAKPPKRILKHPVVRVSWYDAQSYCRWLSRTTGRTYRLPTEAEWEKAARGDQDGRIYPWGDEITPEHANYDNRRTTAVDQYETGQSPYGCYDMAGNIWEWTSTLWGEPRKQAQFTYPYVYDPHKRENPDAPATEHRIYRGGAYDQGANQVGCTVRSYFVAPNIADKTLGSRVVLEIDK
jgi:formylglycine-generating enzyme required for sulfatase activity